MERVGGDGTRSAGRVSGEGTIRIDGTVEGDVQADWVVVGETGKIRVNTRTRGMIVGGCVEGNIEATETLELKEKATMVGEIHAPKLGVAEGAVFDGRARMKGAAEPAGIQEGNVRPLVPTKTGT